MMAADGNTVDMKAMTTGKDGGGRRAGAEVDDGGAEFSLVAGQRRQSRGIRSRGHALDGEVAALDAKHEVFQRRQIRRDHMQIDGQHLPEHSARIANAARLIEIALAWSWVKARRFSRWKISMPLEHEARAFSQK